MKILFLDIDGVLNSARYDREKATDSGNIDPSRLELVKEIIEKTEARIVLSSTWREHWEKDPTLCDGDGTEINRIFAEHGLIIFDKTPVLPRNSSRAAEIGAWLEEHPDVTVYAILDDETFGWTEELTSHWVKTNHRIGYGLEETHVARVIELLNAN